MFGAVWGYWGWGWWFFGGIVFLLIIWLLASTAERRRTISPEERVLRERYARGEISIEEYRQRMRDLGKAA